MNASACITTLKRAKPQSNNPGVPTLFLEIYLPAEFSSDPDQTQLNQLIRILTST